MPLTYKVLGQNNPSASGLTTLYTVPSSTEAICSSISICNLLNTATSYRIAVRPTGESIANKHYVAYDSALPGNDAVILTMGISLGATDVVSIYAASSGVAFSLFGSEKS